MNTSLAITISPPSRVINNKLKEPFKHLYADDKNYIEQTLKYNRIGRYIIYPELDPKGRLHYHGVINLDSNELVRFYKHAFHKLKTIGFVDIKPLKTFTDKFRWTIYMSKDWGITRDILDLNSPILKVTRNKLNKTSATVAGESLSNLTLFDYFF
ncbi:MAG: replicase [Cressdnaviricota sp.]|nr:MAG: replicase [Cressdnaviricota sp.]